MPLTLFYWSAAGLALFSFSDNTDVDLQVGMAAESYDVPAEFLRAFVVTAMAAAWPLVLVEMLLRKD